MSRDILDLHTLSSGREAIMAVVDGQVGCGAKERVHPSLNFTRVI